MAQASISPESKYLGKDKLSKLESNVINTILSISTTFCGAIFTGAFGYAVYESMKYNQNNSMLEANIAATGLGLIIMTGGIVAGYLNEEK